MFFFLQFLITSFKAVFELLTNSLLKTISIYANSLQLFLRSLSTFCALSNSKAKNTCFRFFLCKYTIQLTNCFLLYMYRERERVRCKKLPPKSFNFVHFVIMNWARGWFHSCIFWSHCIQNSYRAHDFQQCSNNESSNNWYAKSQSESAGRPQKSWNLTSVHLKNAIPRIADILFSGVHIIKCSPW